MVNISVKNATESWAINSVIKLGRKYQSYMISFLLKIVVNNCNSTSLMFTEHTWFSYPFHPSAQPCHIHNLTSGCTLPPTHLYGSKISTFLLCGNFAQHYFGLKSSDSERFGFNNLLYQNLLIFKVNVENEQVRVKNIGQHFEGIFIQGMS